MNDETAIAARFNKIMDKDIKDQFSPVYLELEVKCHKQFKQLHGKHQKVSKLVTKCKCTRIQQIHIKMYIECIMLERKARTDRLDCDREELRGSTKGPNSAYQTSWESTSDRILLAPQN